VVINQGDIFWIDTGPPDRSEPGYRRPYVVVQNNAFNASRIHTIVVCAITTNLRLAHAPGNVLLHEGEGNLPKHSVVNVSQLFTVDRDDLEELVGTLSARRVRDILNGIAIVLEPRDLR
jgi:mRNA interferase MazF